MPRNHSEKMPNFVSQYLSATEQCSEHILACQYCTTYFRSGCRDGMPVYLKWQDMDIEVNTSTTLPDDMPGGFTGSWPNTLRRLKDFVRASYGA